jgi:DsbC/DsbD-like thiol-disulfide interchange protein
MKYMPLLSRRSLLVLFAQCPTLAFAAPQPYTLRLLQGGFDGTSWQLGLHVRLDEGWKTYWRVPGDGGIPPDISAKGDNLKSLSFDYPLPIRIVGEEGENIGYTNEVVFPVTIHPVDPAAPLTLEIAAFLGVCQTVCIPAQFKADVSMTPGAATGTDDDMLAAWRARVPAATPKPIVLKAEAVASPDLQVRLTLAPGVHDLFVEGNPMHYYASPKWSDGRDMAIVRVSGAKNAADIKGQLLRITLDMGGNGLEQRVMVV